MRRNGGGGRRGGTWLPASPALLGRGRPGKINFSRERGGAEEETVRGKRGNGCEEGGPLALLWVVLFRFFFLFVAPFAVVSPPRSA